MISEFLTKKKGSKKRSVVPKIEEKKGKRTGKEL